MLLKYENALNQNGMVSDKLLALESQQAETGQRLAFLQDEYITRSFATTVRTDLDNLATLKMKVAH